MNQSNRFKLAVVAGVVLTATHLGCMFFGYWYALTEQKELGWLLGDAVKQGQVGSDAAREAIERHEHQRP